MCAVSEAELRHYNACGYLRPFHLLDESEIAAVDRAGSEFQSMIQRRREERGLATWSEYVKQVDGWLPWEKSAHFYALEIRTLAVRREIVDRIAALIGKNIVLWGAQWIAKLPGEKHRWHVDVETLAWPSVNVWVGLRNVSPASGIRLLPGTHGLDSAQSLSRRESFSVNDDMAVVQAASRHSRVRRDIVNVSMTSGDALIFHGREWHASRNETNHVRTAMLLQYSPPDVDVRIPVTFVEPVQWHSAAVPCLEIRAQP